jgi:polyhydroxyalkanoate synthesis regulator phasin
MSLEDLRKTIEATVGNLTPAKARKMAKDLLEPGTAKDQVSKTAVELLEWSQRNRERLREFVAHEVSRQMKTVGVATQADVDALKRRVRELERGTPSSKKKTSTRKASASKSPSRKTAVRKTGGSSRRGSARTSNGTSG